MGRTSVGCLPRDPLTSWCFRDSASLCLTKRGRAQAVSPDQPRPTVRAVSASEISVEGRLDEESEWPLVPRSEGQNILAQYAVLTNMAGADAQRNIQVRPYATSRMNAHESAAQSGQRAYSTTADVGGDVTIGLSSNTTLNATINPDFGQVEADPAQLNLSAF